MPLNLLQAEKSKKINVFLGRKGIVLNRENNINNVLTEIANRRYSHVFTSPETALSKKFKQNFLNCFSFTEHLCLLDIDKIYLVEEWGKDFQLIYVKIEKVRKRILCHILFLRISAMLTKKVRQKVAEKPRFLSNY